ncbi:MAG: redoxin domain-containing protein [Fastidiosipilaceae bacterium]|jgi:peroxiredoxin|nr:redoxin domain-containing protein [Clostridiaceae bacterium]
MSIIEKGKPAPEFSLVDQNENVISLKDLKGKKVLLSWHPLAWTSVCLDQMRSLETHAEAFMDNNIVALGLSVDAQPSKSAWAKFAALEKTPILADFYPHGAVATAYGIFDEENGFSKRANILIDEDGIVMWSKEYPLATLPNLGEIFDQL